MFDINVQIGSSNKRPNFELNWISPATLGANTVRSIPIIKKAEMTTAYTAVNSLPMATLPTTNGLTQIFRASVTNTSDVTYSPDGLAAAPVFGLGGQPLQGDEIVAGGNVTLVSYVGPLLNSGSLCWVLLSCDGGAQQVANATHSQHAITKAQVEALLASAIPAGTIIDFAGATAPSGYLVCPAVQTNVSRTTYASLFAAIGTTWGAGNGSSTFGLPWFPADYVSSQASGNVGTQTVGQVISHQHAGGWIDNGPGVPGSGFELGSSGFTNFAGGSANLAASVRVQKCIKT